MGVLIVGDELCSPMVYGDRGIGVLFSQENLLVYASDDLVHGEVLRSPIVIRHFLKISME